MPIVFHCECGRPLRASADTAGKKTKCPGCGHILIIPSVSDKSVSQPVHAATANAPVEEDPFALAIDWNSPEQPRATDHEADQTSSSGVIKIDAAQADTPTEDVPRTEDGSLQYRVLSQKDQGFSGKFNPSKLEDALNAHARKGWSLKVAVTMNVPGHGGNHDELVVILER